MRVHGRSDGHGGAEAGGPPTHEFASSQPDPEPDPCIRAVDMRYRPDTDTHTLDSYSMTHTHGHARTRAVGAHSTLRPLLCSQSAESIRRFPFTRTNNEQIRPPDRLAQTVQLKPTIASYTQRRRRELRRRQ